MTARDLIKLLALYPDFKLYLSKKQRLVAVDGVLIDAVKQQIIIKTYGVENADTR
jgi:hypothetical protein